MPTASTTSNLLNITALADRYGIHKDTVRSRIQNAGIEPHKTSGQHKIFLLTAALDRILRAEDGLKASRQEKTEVETELKRLDLAKKKGEVAPVEDFEAATSKIFGTLYKRIVMHMPKAVTKKIRSAKTEGDAEKILKDHAAKVFNELRADYEEFIK